MHRDLLVTIAEIFSCSRLQTVQKKEEAGIVGLVADVEEIEEFKCSLQRGPSL